MIVPRNNLLLATACFVVPTMSLVVLWRPFAPVGLLLLVAFAFAVVIDVMRGVQRTREVEVTSPDLLRVTKNRESELELDLKAPEGIGQVIDLGILLPPEIRSDDPVVRVTIPPEAKQLRLKWKCTPLKRGSYTVRACFMEFGTPWNFWGLRRTFELNLEVRVYPNILTERKNLAALFLNRGNYGIHAQRQVGKGRDFEKLRNYLPGDSMDDIHWKATAKRNSPVTKVFQIERTQEVYVIIDGSRLSARTVKGQLDDGQEFVTTELERFITAAMIMGMVAERQSDLFGVMAFSDTVNRFIRARNGRGHYGAVRDALYSLQPSSHTPDFNEVCSYIRMNLRRRALLIFLTNLDDPVLAENFEQNINLISGQHLVLVNMLRPAGARQLFTGDDVSSVDEIMGELGSHHRWQTLREVQNSLRKRGVDFHLLENEKMSADLVSQYLSVKQRQLI